MRALRGRPRLSTRMRTSPITIMVVFYMLERKPFDHA